MYTCIYMYVRACMHACIHTHPFHISVAGLQRRQSWRAIPISHIRTKRALGIGLLDHLDTRVDHSQIISTHTNPISPAARVRHPPTFRSRHSGGAVLRKPRPEVRHYEDGYEDDGASVYPDSNPRSHVYRYSRRSKWRNNPTKRHQGRRQGDHHGNGWHGNNRQLLSYESLKHFGNSRNNMENYGDSNYGSKKGMFDSGSGHPHRRINGARHRRTSHRFGYKHPHVSKGHNNGNMLPPGGHYRQNGD